MIRRGVTRVPVFAAPLGVAILLSAAPGGVVPQRDDPRSWRLTFETVLAGVAAGEASVWEGSVQGAVRGPVRVELRQVEGPAEAASPVWHVVTLWSATDPSGARSFVAQLEGMVDWRTGITRLSGEITQGWMKGAWVEQEGRFVNLDATGSLTIAPQVARR